MAELRHLFAHPSGATVRIYQQDSGLQLGDGWFYLSCENCGVCSEPHPDELEVCQQALRHAEGHDRR